MARYAKNPERSQVTEDREKLKEDMEGKCEDMEDPTSDVEVERDTLDNLEGGTQEGLDSAAQEIVAAQDASTQEFEEKSTELDAIHAEGEEFEGEMDAQSDTVTSDQQKISDAAARLHSDAPSSQLKAAEAALEEDKEFLETKGRQSREAREKTHESREQMRQRIENARRK